MQARFLEMQTRLTDVLGLHRTNSRVSINSITSFAASVNTKKAYKKFLKNLHTIGVTPDMISQKEAEILNIFETQNIAISGQSDDSKLASQSQLPKVSGFSGVYRNSPVLIDRNILIKTRIRLDLAGFDHQWTF